MVPSTLEATSLGFLSVCIACAAAMQAMCHGDAVGIRDFYNEELLYRLFGVNAELLIDHAWGWEPCTMADIKAYKPQNNSVGNGQILPCAYTAEKTRLVVREMAESLALGLVDKSLVTDQLVLTVGYDRENLTDPARRETYHGAVTTDRYGRQIPKHAHGTANLSQPTSSSRKIVEAVLALYDRIIDPALLTRRLNLTGLPCSRRGGSGRGPRRQCGTARSFHRLHRTGEATGSRGT